MFQPANTALSRKSVAHRGAQKKIKNSPPLCFSVSSVVKIFLLPGYPAPASLFIEYTPSTPPTGVHPDKHGKP